MTLNSDAAPLHLPIIDIGPLLDSSSNTAARKVVAQQLGDACEFFGFFYVKNHKVDSKCIGDLFSEGRRFFQLPVAEKNKISMKNSQVFRGYFEVGGELTSYRRDWKEGLYFGDELGDDHPDVIAKKPMHGKNQWPESIPELKSIVQNYMQALTLLGHAIMEGIAMSLGLDENYFRQKFTAQPFTPFRLFHYPSDPLGVDDDQKQRWGVGQHTDYGVLTMLAQDEIGGLQVKHRSGNWIAAPPIPDTFVVNIGDMLEMWTNGKYKATPHRVLNASLHDRLSAPFFFDPAFDAIIDKIDTNTTLDNPSLSQQKFPMRYGDYILKKVQRNFPELEKLSLK